MRLSEHDRALPEYKGDLLQPTRLEEKGQVQHKGHCGRPKGHLRLRIVVVRSLDEADYLVISYFQVWSTHTAAGHIARG